MLEKLWDPLLTWYQMCRRDLPWRRDKDPYHIWVSEIMLQQTRVAAVIPYYERFLKRLPDIATLASCGDEELDKLWEGLGYYSRVHNMKKTAQILVKEYKAAFPKTEVELLKLPGIGPYTAGAIGSIAFGLPIPAVDGNVLRILARILNDENDIADPKVKKEKEELLRASMPEGHAGDWNQALMELGATVCLPNGEPHCGECPIWDQCEAHRLGKENTLPVKRTKKARKIQKKTVFLIRDGDNILLKKRSEKGLLAGLYGLPETEGFLSVEDVLKWVEKMGFLPLKIQELGPAKHIFTHIEWHMIGYEIRVADTALDPASADLENHKGKALQLPNDDSVFYILAQPEDVRKRYSIPSAYAAYLRKTHVLPHTASYDNTDRSERTGKKRKSNESWNGI